MEEWLRAPDWPKRKHHVELVILTGFREKAVPVLTQLLLRKGTREELALWEKVPIVRNFYGPRLTRAELKERILTSLNSLEEIGWQCHSTVLELALNQRESPHIRQLAIRALAPTAAYNQRAKAAFARLRNDPPVAADATRAIYMVQEHEEEQRALLELHQIRSDMDKRAATQTEPFPRAPDLLTRTSLWEKGKPGLEFQAK